MILLGSSNPSKCAGNWDTLLDSLGGVSGGASIKDLPMLVTGRAKDKSLARSSWR